MKKYLSLTLLVVFAMALMVACGPQADETTPEVVKATSIEIPYDVDSRPNNQSIWYKVALNDTAGASEEVKNIAAKLTGDYKKVEAMTPAKGKIVINTAPIPAETIKANCKYFDVYIKVMFPEGYNPKESEVKKPLCEVLEKGIVSKGNVSSQPTKIKEYVNTYSFGY